MSKGGQVLLEGAREARGRGPRRCRNRCFFCYVKGLPPRLRPSLYLRDDDLLHSFLFGSFVTLTNLSERDWKLLEGRRLSPLQVSVHTTNLELRRLMLGNPRAPDILGQLGRLGSLGIRVHAQVVLCPGLNDGAHLEETIEDLVRLHQVVESVALVPVGLSLHLKERLASRPGPWPLTHFTPQRSRGLLEWAAPRQEAFRRALGRSFLHLADEFYLLADCPIPEAPCYDGFPQYQNGVGMVRTLLDGWVKFERKVKERVRAGDAPGLRRLVVLCGTLIAPILKDLSCRLGEITGQEVIVAPVQNRLFGPQVTVSGLLAGRDLLEALPPLGEGDVVLVPRRALEASGRLFLDSLSLRRFRSLARPARVVLVERPGDLGRALWGSRAVSKEGVVCAA